MISQGTTPRLILRIPTDITGLTVEIVFRQLGRTMRFLNDRMQIVPGEENSLVYISLTQEETLKLYPGSCVIAGRLIDSTGYTRKVAFPPAAVESYPYPHVLTYGEVSGNV